MKLSLILAPLIAAKVPHEVLMETVLAFEAQQTDALEKRRANDRKKTGRRRSRQDVSDREWHALRAAVFERDGFSCTYCGADGNQVDHIHPLSRGGKSELGNLCVACSPCNARKKDMTVAEWRGAQ